MNAEDLVGTIHFKNNVPTLFLPHFIYF